MNTPTHTSKPWYKNWKIIVPIVLVLGLIGFIAGQLEEKPDTTASEETGTETVSDDAFQSCQEVRNAGITELTNEDPRWNPTLDRDGNGVACESNQETPSEETTESHPEVSPATPEQADGAPLLPAGVEPHPGCVQDDSLIHVVGGSITDRSLSLGNMHIIEDGGNTWIGATVFGADGEMDSRSDVWLWDGQGLYTVSGGARQISYVGSAPGVSMTDEHASGVDSCVIASTINR